jgi:GxxExxY protein
MLRDEELTYRICGCVFEVYRQLGHGFLESVYQRALVHELSGKGVLVEEEKPVAISYKGHEIGGFWLDLIVENRVTLARISHRPPASLAGWAGCHHHRSFAAMIA